MSECVLCEREIVCECVVCVFLGVYNTISERVNVPSEFPLWLGYSVPKSKVIWNKQQHLYLAKILHFGVDNTLKFWTNILALCSSIFAISVRAVYAILCSSARLLFQPG